MTISLPELDWDVIGRQSSQRRMFKLCEVCGDVCEEAFCGVEKNSNAVTDEKTGKVVFYLCSKECFEALE